MSSHPHGSVCRAHTSGPVCLMATVKGSGCQEGSLVKNSLYCFPGVRPFLKLRVKVPHIKRERCQPGLPFRGLIMKLHFPPICRQLLGSRLVTRSDLLQWTRERFSKARLQLIVRGLALEQKGFCMLALVCARTKVFLSFPRG